MLQDEYGPESDQPNLGQQAGSLQIVVHIDEKRANLADGLLEPSPDFDLPLADLPARYASSKNVIEELNYSQIPDRRFSAPIPNNQMKV